MRRIYETKKITKLKKRVTKKLACNVRLHIKSYHPFYINQYVITLYQLIVKAFDCEVNQRFLPKKYSTITVLRSPHVDKKAQDHFERVFYQRELSFPIINFNSADINLLLVILLKCNTLNHSVICNFKISSRCGYWR